jgi:hypothetical protein
VFVAAPVLVDLGGEKALGSGNLLPPEKTKPSIKPIVVKNT